MCEIIKKDYNHKHLIEVHNRPYLVKLIDKKLENKSIVLFFHNDPLTMKGSKTVKERLDLISRVNYICCVSKFVKEQFLMGIENKDKKVVVIHNGVSRSLKKFPRKKREIIFVGRIVKEKGVHLYVDAIKNIYSELNDWSFKIIGSVKLGNDIHHNNYSKQNIENFNIELTIFFESILSIIIPFLFTISFKPPRLEHITAIPLAKKVSSLLNWEEK